MRRLSVNPGRRLEAEGQLTVSALNQRIRIGDRPLERLLRETLATGPEMEDESLPLELPVRITVEVDPGARWPLLAR